MAIKDTLYFVFLIMLPVAMMAKQVPLMPEAWDDIDYVEASTPDDYEPTDQTIGKCNGREMKKQIESIKSLLDDLSTKFESCQGSQACSDCPAGWLRYGGQCYYIDDTPTTKEADARTACRNMGADLSVIRSAAENKFIFNLMKKQRTLTFLGVWLGMHRSTADSKFYWVDDTTLEGQYQNWGDNQPDNVGNTEHCAHMYGTPGDVYGYNKIPGKWNDLPCEYTWHGNEAAPVILCQKPISDCVPA